MRNKINLKTATLEQIEAEMLDVLGTQYGHNMICIMLNVVQERFGEEEADRLFETYQQ